ncbi:MAG TPA: hypothetical protein VIP57_06960 [Candidatus Dormibacteraeota bacterium]
MASEKKSEKSQVRNRLKRAAHGAKPNKAVVTGMHNELRAHILILLNERVASRPELCKELGASFDSVRYEMEVLKKTKPPLIELVHEKPVRGTVEKFYRATTQAYLDPSEWPGVPDAVKAGMRGSLLDLLVDDVVAAVKDGTFDSLPNAHMSWIPMILDEQGWRELTAILLRTMKEARKVKEDSAERLIGKDEEGTSCSVSMLGYPSANEKRRVGPPAPAGQSKAKAKRASRKKAAAKKTKTTGKGSTGKAAVKSKRKSPRKATS